MIAITNIQKYIRENLNKDLSLRTLADMAYFNPNYFSRLFWQVTGKYLSDYIHDLKLEKAQNLLKQPKYKIGDVAMAVGYQSASYFNRFFKKSMKMTPQAYRETNLYKQETQ